MKKLTLAIVIAFAAVLAVAQGPGGRPGGGPGGGRGMRMDPKQMVAGMTKELNLSAAQQKKVLDMFEARRADMEKARKAGGARPSRDQFQKMRAEFDAKMKKILTKDQAAKWDKIQAERRKQFGGGRRGGPGGPGGPPRGGGA